MGNIIYILSLPHSGSTLLEMILSNFSNVVGVGEIKYLFRAENKDKVESLYFNEICSCGKSMNECEYWRNFKKILLKAINYPFEEKYKLHFNYFREFYGKNAIMIDNSKDLEIFQKLAEIQEVSFIPIFLIKDVRSQVYSGKRKSKKLGLKKNFATLRLFLWWYRGNKKILKTLQKLEYSFLKVSYEKFVFDPWTEIEKIANYIGLKETIDCLSFKNSKAHSIFANRMRYLPEKKRYIRYDYGWFLDAKICFWYSVLKPLQKFNEKLVYM